MHEKTKRPQKVSVSKGKRPSFRKSVRDILQIITRSESNEAAVNDSLIQVLTYYGSDRVYIGYFDEENVSLTFIHEVSAGKRLSMSEFLKSQFNGLPVIYEEDFPWWIGNIKKGIDSVIYSSDLLPDEAYLEKQLMLNNGMKSTLTTSIYSEGRIRGFLCVDFTSRIHTWSERDIENIHFFADLFSIMIDNKEMEKAVTASAAEVFKSSAIFRIIFDTLPVGIELYDENGYLVNINPFDLELLGASKEQILGINLFDNPHISQENLAKIKSGQEAMYETDYTFDTVTEKGYYSTTNANKTMRLLGRSVPLKGAKGEIIGYLALVHNDTSYYQKKEQLRDSLQKLKMAINSANSYIWEYDVKEGLVHVDFSLLGNEINQYVKSGDAVETTTWDELLSRIHENDLSRVTSQMEQLLSGEIHSFTETYRQYYHDELYWFTTFYRVYKYDSKGKPLKIICLSRDITHEREKEIALLKEKERNRVKNAFLENLSHELRTPLNVIVGFSNILADVNDTEENRYFVELIHKNNEVMLQVIENLLSFSKVENGALQYVIEEVDVKEICREATHLRSSNQKDHIPLIFDDEQPSILIQSDRDSLIQVIFHLLDNAYKFTEEGTVTLRYSLYNQKNARVEIIDTGIGMTDEEIASIYDHFFKSDQFKVGLGLGLSICKKIVEDLGGCVGVNSKKGEGSNFWFNIPLVAKN